MQHYLDGVCSYRSWIIKFTRASTQKENHLRSSEKAPSTRFLATFSAQALSFLSSILSLLNPLAHLWLTSLEEGYWSGSRKSTKQSVGSGAERAAMCAGHSAPSTHPHTMLGTEQPTGRFFKYELFSLHQVCRKALPVARGLVTSFSAQRLELDTLSCLCLSQVTC